MRVGIKRIAGDNNYDLFRQDNVNIRWVHHQEDDDMTDNAKADIYNRYRIVARRTNELCGAIPTVLFTAKSTLVSPIIYGNPLYDPIDNGGYISKSKLPIFYDDFIPSNNNIYNSGVIIHEVVIHTYIKEREYGIKWKYETIPDKFDVDILLRKMKIDILLS